jgi:hypothetical protein
MPNNMLNCTHLVGDDMMNHVEWVTVAFEKHRHLEGSFALGPEGSASTVCDH